MFPSIRDLLCHHKKGLDSFTFPLQVSAAIVPEGQFNTQYAKHFLSLILPSIQWEKSHKSGISESMEENVHIFILWFAR